MVIAKNEEDRISRCLRSVPWATERWVLLDEGTTDATAQAARQCGAAVIREPWRGHVGQKNRALELATTPWVLSLDADEWLDEAANTALRAALAHPGPMVGFRFARASCWLGHELRHGRWYPDRKLRVVRRGAARWTGTDPHDRLIVDGPVQTLAGDIRHVPYRNVWEHLETIDRYTALAARALHDEGVRSAWYSPALHASLHFVDSLIRRSAWRDGLPGLAVAALGAGYSGLKWHRLRALARAGPGAGGSGSSSPTGEVDPGTTSARGAGGSGA